MKFRLFTLGLFLFCTYSLQSQDYHLGLRLGYSEAALRATDEGGPGISNRQAFQIGFVHAYHKPDKNWGFSVEFGYLLKGARVDNAAIDYRWHFLSMPVLIDIYPTEKLRIGIGPEFNYLHKGRNNVNDTTSFSLHGTYDRLEIAGVVSASYALDFFVDVGVRYSHGLNTLANSDAILNRTNIRTSSFQVFFYFKIAN